MKKNPQLNGIKERLSNPSGKSPTPPGVPGPTPRPSVPPPAGSGESPTTPPVGEPKKRGRGRPPGSGKKEQGKPPLPPDVQAQVDMAIPLIKSLKKQIVRGAFTSPAVFIKASYKTRKPALYPQYKEIWDFTDDELGVIDTWGGALFDMYLPRLIKHIELLVVLLAIGNIGGLYLSRWSASKKIGEAESPEKK